MHSFITPFKYDDDRVQSPKTIHSHIFIVQVSINTNTHNKSLLINIGQKRQGGEEHESQTMEEIHIR